MAGKAPVLDEVIFEMHQVGNYVRVTAMDPATLTEVVTSGPSNVGTFSLRQAAKRKLEYVLKKNAQAKADAEAVRKTTRGQLV